MSKKNRGKKQTTESNVHMERPRPGNTTTSHAPVSLEDRMDLIDNKLEDIAGEMDRDYMAYGRTCARLFRALVDAAVVLPDMELYTTLLTVDNNSDTLTVVLKRGKLEKMCHPERYTRQDGNDGQDDFTVQDESDAGQDNARSGDRFCDDCMGCKGCSGCPGPDDDDDDWEDDEEENLREY